MLLFSTVAVLAGPSSVSAQVQIASRDVSGASEADLRFIRAENAPLIASESFQFRPDGWIIGRVREGQTDFWRLSNPQPMENVELLQPELAAKLNRMTEQLGERGEYRAQAEAILSSAGFKGADLDASLAAGSVAWNTNMDWANVLQARLDDTHIFYVAFYTVHDHPNRAENVPVDAAIVLLPGAVSTRKPIEPAKPVSQRPFQVSQAAIDYARSGDYARCVQAGLGVTEDAQIGPGTNRAWQAWLAERKLPETKLTNENAGQACGAFLGKARPGIDRLYVQRFFFPLTDVGIPGILEGVQADPNFVPTATLDLPNTTMMFEYSEEKVEQAPIVSIGGTQQLPIGGFYFLSGTYEVEEPWRLLEQLTKRDHALAMFNFGNAVLRSFVEEQGGEMIITHDMLRFATDDLPAPDGTGDDVLWSDLGFLGDGRRLLAADIGFPEINNLRYVVLFADGDALAGSLMPGPPPG